MKCIVNRSKLRKFIVNYSCNRLEVSTDQVQVGVAVAKRFIKQVRLQDKTVYFGKIDLIYDPIDSDWYYHVTYEDDDADDFSFGDFKKVSSFYSQSTIIDNCRRQENVLC